MHKIPKRGRPALASQDLTGFADQTPEVVDEEGSPEPKQSRGTPHDHAALAGQPAEYGSPPNGAHPPVNDTHASGPASPAGNRARFMSGLQPNKISCDLSSAPVSPGLRFSFEAVIAVVYPASTSAPERRYIELMDAFGTTGITLWNAYVHAVSPLSVGCVAKFTRLALTMHNGKKNLTMAKDSTVHVETASYQGMLPTWWHSLLSQPMVNCLQFHDTQALNIVNISGILGHIQMEEKMVKGVPKSLLVLFLTDRTGKIEIRSWNHSDTEFLPFKERPVLFKRVRVCLYAGTRTGELLTGPNGSTITAKFDDEDLKKYWSE